MTEKDVEALASAMLRADLKPKTVRNVLVFLNAIFEHGIERRWARENPVSRASRPKRRREGDSNSDLQSSP